LNPRPTDYETNNTLVRLNREARHRKRVIGSFTDEQATLMLDDEAFRSLPKIPGLTFLTLSVNPGFPAIHNDDLNSHEIPIS